MRNELVIATKNKKKLREIKEILKGLDLKITSLLDYPVSPRIVENGRTFRQNAVKKALAVARFTDKAALGEDSGLCVEALSGRPGIYSSRFSGKDKSDLKNNLKLLKLLGSLALPERKAHYVCAVALADKSGVIAVSEGKCHGLVGFRQKGRFGFGYDPLFIVPPYGKTFAELGAAVKHRMSHRFRALAKMKKILKRRLSLQSVKKHR